MIDFILSRQGCSLFSLHRSVSVMLLNFVIVPMFFSSMFPPAKTNLSMRNATRPFLLDMEHGIFLSSHSAMFLLPGFNIPLNNLEVTFGKSFLMVVSVLNGVSTVDIFFSADDNIGRCLFYRVFYYSVCLEDIVSVMALGGCFICLNLDSRFLCIILLSEIEDFSNRQAV